jgi:hypothetical protein
MSRNGTKERDIYWDNPKICPFCGKTLDYEKRRNKFCSHSCSAAYNNKGVRRHGKETNACLKCGKKTSSYKNKFCTHECQHIYHYEAYIEKWLTDASFGNGERLSTRIRKWLKSSRGDCCENCGWSEVNSVTGKVPVTVDHIDGNCENNRPENLKLLCPNCHSLTPTYGNLNRGKGRKSRREKRKDQKKRM